MRQIVQIILFLSLMVFTFQVNAEEITVNPGESIQQAIDSANNGDVINIKNGTYNEDLDTSGKAISLIGESPTETIINGTGTGSVVSITSGEADTTIIDSLTITGGVAGRGGGIYIVNSSPIITRCIIRDNQADNNGSGICVSGESANPLIQNNLFIRNIATENGADPHGVQLTSSSASIINNTIVLGDSNGIFLDSSSTGDIRNNIIAFNGSMTGRNSVKGRGICDFGDTATIKHNLFFRNRAGAFLGDRNFRKIRAAERGLKDSRLSDNIDSNPRFRNRRKEFFDLRRGSRARNNGDPAENLNDLDGTRNDIGFTGGPEASSAN